ncbi:hypothetical protein C8T65DRAFT_543134, partial [Cerioporus squamosus]
QIIGVTADNATPNDMMIDEMAKVLPNFGGQNACARCFDHIVNLCAKSVLKPFD